MIVSDLFVATASVVTVKVAVVEPAGTITEAGTEADGSLEVRFTVIEVPVGGAPFRVTVPVETIPPTTVVGANVTLATVGGVIVRFAVTGEPSFVAVMVAVAVVPTALVVTVNVPVVFPAAIATVAGTVALALFDAKVIVTPPAGAGSFKVIVPVEGVLPNTEVGFSVRL